MSTLKQWFAHLVWWRNDAPGQPRRKSRKRVRSKPYFPDLVDLDDENNTFQALEYKPQDTELPVIRTLGERQSNPGSFISLARQCFRCENILSDLEPSSNIVRLVKFTSAMLRDSAITCELCFVILQGISKHNCLGDTAGLTVKVDIHYAHIIVNANGKDIRFQSVPYLPCPWLQLGLGHEVAVPGSMQCLQRVKKWISYYSLCIIQDDADDWARESSAMANIYENAYLTIAATSSKDSSGGLFSTRRVRQELVCGRRYGADGAPYLVAAVEDVPHPKLTDESRNLAQKWPLLTRAWVFQERLLSPRVVHFASPEMFWECREMSSCECGRLQESVKSHYEKTANDLPQLLRKQWLEMVQSYSALNLSYADDKLPALSGVATKMSSRRSKSRYLAGLWSDSLEFDLLWINKDAMVPGKTSNARPDGWRAPTWSWASIDAPIKFPLKDHTQVQIHFKVLDVYCKPATNDETGQVRKGSLTLEAPAVLGEVVALMDQRPELKMGNTTYSLTGGNRFYPDNPADPFGNGLGNIPSVKEVLCMGLATGSGFHSQTQLALVLYRRREKDPYERIGMVHQWCEVTRSSDPNLAIYEQYQTPRSERCFEPLEGELRKATIV
ncbi:hypothetical protein CEP54_015481 [Fusarium duplospermum]|uniref:Heterokaryon incompatibility domain-containing protein n=1 Tax=Fusarium duplospermum TaxID=1325734 RepID=A0A428NNR9_9HYPO|nr:hypothetical protein CEP54_015481 [Fusarium duplospermum]